MKRVANYLLLVALTGALVFLTTGCLTDEDPSLNHQILPYLFGSEIFHVCVPQIVSLPPGGYARYTVAVNSDGSVTTLNEESTNNRGDCDYSVDTADEVDPSALQASNAGSAPSTAGTQSSTAHTLAAGSSFQPIDALPYARPVPFLPLFSNADAAAPPTSCDPNASFYAVNHKGNTVTHYMACTLAPIATIPLFGNPLHPALTPDYSLLLVTDNDGAVDFIDTSTDKVVKTLQFPAYPSGIAITPDGKTAYVTDYDYAGRLMVIDIPSRTLTSTIPLPYPYPKQVFLTPDGAEAWVNYLDGTVVSILDTLSGTISGSVSTGGQAETGIAFNATGTRAYIATQPADVKVFDTATLTQTGDIAVGSRPVDIILTLDGARLYVTSFTSSTISVIDAHTNKLLSNLKAPATDQRAFVLLPSVP
ncbi:MAG TPA: YncE family protein [Bryobacteraceae bacterium]|nr:YncE family protein [Bryobacteraceae bacterium]